MSSTLDCVEQTRLCCCILGDSRGRGERAGGEGGEQEEGFVTHRHVKLQSL